MKNQLPAYPLITIDPYFSYWSFSNKLNNDEIKHWTGKNKIIRGEVIVDDTSYTFMGKGKNKIAQIDIQVTPLITKYIFLNEQIKLEALFYSPTFLDELEICARPISNIDFNYQNIDGKKHQIRIKMIFDEGLCYDLKKDSKIDSQMFNLQSLNIGSFFKVKQPILESSGDDLRINRGYFYVAADKNNSEIKIIKEERITIQVILDLRENDTSFILVGYDDVSSIEYYGTPLKGYWTKKYSNIIEAFKDAYSSHDVEFEKCLKRDKRILSEAKASGGKELQKIVTASYRQSIAGHKIVEGKDKEILFISKECFSNGCAATVDVSYPSSPLYLLYNPELVLGMIRPIIKFARMPVWKYDFAPHDAGRYPLLGGNVYGIKNMYGKDNNESYLPIWLHTKEDDLFDLHMQMPVEESANMLIMIYAACKKLNDCNFLKENIDLFQKWVKYLIEFGKDPQNQLCSDDFAGHLSHNINLAIKATLGIEAFAGISSMLDDAKSSEVYHLIAKEYADSIVKNGYSEEHSYLTFEDSNTWSLKYNMIWDKYFNSNLFDDSLFEKEFNYYLTKQNKYGIPLDNRKDYTKSDRLVEVSCFSDNIKERQKFLSGLVTFLKAKKSRVPFGDWYDTKTGEAIMFRARTVQGGCFMPILIDSVKGEKR